jgi:hypothetical protein
MLLAAVPVAFAAPSATTTDEIVRETVTWTLSPDQCLSIQDPISATGKRVQVVTTTVQSDGSKEIIDHDFVTGTAKDTKGRTYYFVYSNQTVQLVPRSGSPIKASMTDTFELTSLSTRGSPNNLKLAFVWRWTYSPPAEELWPPMHNLTKVFTRGDPLTCDPI